VESALAAPRAPEVVSVAERVRRGTFVVLGVGLSVALLGWYLAARTHNPSVDLARMQASVAALRRARAAARARLLAAAGDSGEIALEGSGGRRLRWWASGPRTAPTAVLLAAEDGETAAVWGEVHARLLASVGAAGEGTAAAVRIVSYHCVGGKAHTPGTCTPPLTLRVRDAQAALGAACGSSAGPARVVHVHAGIGAWAALALAALFPQRTAGCVLVAPQLTHRSRVLAWMDAVPAASRSPGVGGGGELARLLDPPPLPPTPPSVAMGSTLKDSLDAANPRRRDMVVWWERFGLESARAAVAGRFEEDFRRWRSRASVLSGTEERLLGSLAPGLQGSSVAIRALTWGHTSLPCWMGTDTARAASVHCLMAAVAVGSAMAGGGGAGGAGGAGAGAGVQAAPPPPAAPPPDLLVKVPEVEARHVASLLAGLPRALGLGGGAGSKALAGIEARFKQLAQQVETQPSNFTVTLVQEGEGGAQEGAGGEGLEGEGDLVSFPLQCPELIVGEVVKILKGEGKREAGKGLDYYAKR
jgi:hypothetical protein